MHTEILTKEQKELLPFLKSYNRKFYLVGGTAVALHLGHRRSIDFDLFCYKPFKKSYVINKLVNVPFETVTIFEDVDQLHFIVRGIKLTFFHFPWPVEHGLSVQNILSIPTLKTLGAMKAYALGRRSKWKDYVDLFFMLRYHFTIEEISEEAIRIFGQLFNEKLFRQQLSFHKDIDYSEPVEFLIFAPPEEEIKQFLVDKALDISL
ncbi:MAG: nucleotidyl transferase AbiEii/AbiGii toxin family protein [Mariniphaga sp.]|nr:nucleotidyl transferase AbiEii/AbiGii toxin family protein [Mariniphaga sp.]